MKVIGEFITGVLFLAIVYSLVRPGSQAANAVKTISQVMIDVVGAATGANTQKGTSNG